MMKNLILAILFLPFLSLAQQPIITGITPIRVEAGESVTISGTNLDGRVFFGGVESPTVTGGGNQLIAEVPPGATFGPISVLNSSNLIAQSGQQFYVSFSGNSLATFDTEFTLSSAETDANDICLCDLDGDGLNDAAIAHSVALQTKSEISIYRNTSTAAATSFVKLANINNADNLSGFIATTCSDLDNDGQPELIFTTNQGTNLRHIYVYENQSTPGTINMTYVSSLSLRLPNTSSGDNRVTRRVKAFDMDGDGKNDLIIGNDTDNTLHIYRNTSSGTGNFAFDAATEIMSGNDHSGNIAITDINADGRLDIISSPFRDQAQQSTSSVYVLKNNSLVGRLLFSTEATISNGTARISNIASGDFDQDGLNDVAVASSDAGIITVFLNTSSGNTVSFGPAVTQNITGSPFGIALEDMNGDGDLDIASSEVGGNVVILENESTPGSISFAAEITESTAQTNQNICTGDLNGDGKPDIAYTTNVSPGQVGELGVFANRNCMVPVITPDGTQDQCGSTDTFTLRATNAPGATYTWAVVSGATNIGPPSTTNTATFELTGAPTTATIRVTISSADGLCTTEFDEEVYTIVPAGSGTFTPTINVTPNDSVCVGDNVSLSLASTFNNYLWTLPDGSTSTNASIDITSIDASQAGNYSVVVSNTGFCSSTEVVQNIVISAPPNLEILNNGDDRFCSDGSNDPTLEVSSIAGLSYQWKRNGVVIADSTNVTFTARESGDYTVELTDNNGCPLESNVFTLLEITEPVATISGPTDACEDLPFQFDATSIVDAGFTPLNSWIVRNAVNDTINSGSADSIIVTFDDPGIYQVILTTRYDPADVVACADITTLTVTVAAPPSIAFSVSDGTQKCQLDALTVGITTPRADSIVSYQWTVKDALADTTISTSTQATVDVTTPVGVDSAYAVATIVTNVGCVVTDSVRIENFISDVDISSPQYDLTADSVVLGDDNSIVLQAENLVSDIAWSPASVMTDTTASSVTVFPSQRRTVVTLTGTDRNGCLVGTTLTIILDNIRPRRTFSPNGDGLGFDCWEILNTSDLIGCTVYVFDARGRNILVRESPYPNNCVWDGNYEGTPMPEGVYYFVLKCDDANNSRNGSILMAR